MASIVIELIGLGPNEIISIYGSFMDLTNTPKSSELMKCAKLNLITIHVP